jgi:hypothetical protein
VTRSWWLTHIAAAILGVGIVAARVFVCASVALTFGLAVVYAVVAAVVVVTFVVIVVGVGWPVACLRAIAGERR